MSKGSNVERLLGIRYSQSTIPAGSGDAIREIHERALRESIPFDLFVCSVSLDFQIERKLYGEPLPRRLDNLKVAVRLTKSQRERGVQFLNQSLSYSKYLDAEGVDVTLGKSRNEYSFSAKSLVESPQFAEYLIVAVPMNKGRRPIVDGLQVSFVGEPTSTFRNTKIKNADQRIVSVYYWRLNKYQRPSGDQPEGPFARKVFFATDRKQEAPLSPMEEALPRFGPHRAPGGSMSYGVCTIVIPRRHVIGALETPSIWRLEIGSPDPSRHVAAIDALLFKDESQFLDRVRLELNDSSSVLVFVHGYNVTFQDAVRRTGQLAHDLGYPGTAITYSWPSRGGMAPIRRDESNVDWTTPHLETFLRSLTNLGASQVNVIAHSMGSRAVARALANIAQANPATVLTNFVLAAPDIERDEFMRLARALVTTTKVVTLYASNRDKALKMSKRYTGYPRAGEAGLHIVVCDGVVTIDVSNVVTDDLVGHGYYGDNKTILADIYNLLLGHAPPRFSLLPVKTLNGTYWSFAR